MLKGNGAEERNHSGGGLQRAHGTPAVSGYTGRCYICGLAHQGPPDSQSMPLPERKTTAMTTAQSILSALHLFGGGSGTVHKGEVHRGRVSTPVGIPGCTYLFMF